MIWINAWQGQDMPWQCCCCPSILFVSLSALPVGRHAHTLATLSVRNSLQSHLNSLQRSYVTDYAALLDFGVLYCRWPTLRLQ